jgi:hypothetical protein
MATYVSAVTKTGATLHTGNISNSVSGNVTIEWYLRRDPDPGFPDYNTTEGPYRILPPSFESTTPQEFSKVVTGLLDNTRYALNVKAVNTANGNYAWLGECYFTTGATVDTPSGNTYVSDIFTDGAVLNTGPIPYSGMVTLEWYLRRNPDPGYPEFSMTEGPFIILPASKQNFSKVAVGLEPETDYAFNVKVVNILTGDWHWLGTTYFATLATTWTQKPPYWRWRTSMIAGEPFNLPADEWNDFCAWLNEMRAFKRLGRVRFTSAVSGANVTAAQYNEARECALTVGDFGPYYSNFQETTPRVNPGEEIIPYNFQRLSMTAGYEY